MSKFKDITGQKFGRLAVIEYAGNKKWRCKCDCGNIAEVRRYDLQNGNTKSCGCYHQETITKHKISNTRLYEIYGPLKKH